MKTTCFVRHTTLAKSHMADNSFLEWKTGTSTRFRVKFVPISLKKSDTDWFSLLKERNWHHSDKRATFSLFYIKRVEPARKAIRAVEERCKENGLLTFHLDLSPLPRHLYPTILNLLYLTISANIDLTWLQSFIMDIKGRVFIVQSSAAFADDGRVLSLGSRHYIFGSF